MSIVYHNVWDWTGKTSKSISAQFLSGAGLTPNDLTTQFENVALEETRKGLNERAIEQGLPLSNVVINVSSEIIFVRPPDYVGDPFTRYAVKGMIHAEFDSEEPLIQSPLSPVIVKIIELIIASIVTIFVAYFIVQAVKDVLQSLTTEESKVKTHTIFYDSDGNIISEEWKEEYNVAPSNKGMGSLAVVLAFIVGGIFLFFGMGKKK